MVLHSLTNNNYHLVGLKVDNSAIKEITLGKITFIYNEINFNE